MSKNIIVHILGDKGKLIKAFQGVLLNKKVIRNKLKIHIDDKVYTFSVPENYEVKDFLDIQTDISVDSDLSDKTLLQIASDEVENYRGVDKR